MAARAGRLACIGLVALVAASAGSVGWARSASEPGVLVPARLQELPALALETLDGAAFDLADRSGQPVIVHFFATWCAPCIAEMASLDALAARRDVGITIVAVNVGEVAARIRNVLRDRPERFPILLDQDRAATKRWQVSSLPTSIVLDARLRPVLETEEPLDWQSPCVVAALKALASAKPHSLQPTCQNEEGKRP